MSKEGDPLTPREREVAGLIGDGYTDAEIAQLLGISGNTVHRHRDHIYRKLGVWSRAQVAVWAFRQGLG